MQGTTVTPHYPELVVDVPTQNAFFHTELQERLDSNRVRQLVIVGLSVQRAVTSTARAALERGYDVAVVEDATAGYDTQNKNGTTVAGTEVHWIELTSLSSLGAALTETGPIVDSISSFRSRRSG